jgi:hypothetical protein
METINNKLLKDKDIYPDAEARIPEIDTLDLSARTKARIAEVKRVGKSLPCIFEIRDAQAIQDLHKVMVRKLEWK